MVVEGLRRCLSCRRSKASQKRACAVRILSVLSLGWSGVPGASWSSGRLSSRPVKRAWVTPHYLEVCFVELCQLRVAWSFCRHFSLVGV